MKKIASANINNEPESPADPWIFEKKRDEVVNYLLDHPAKMNNLMVLFFGKESMTTQYAAWVVGSLGEKQPEMLVPFLPKMFKTMQKQECTEAIFRNSFRIFQYQSKPEELEAPLFDLSIRILLNKERAVATKVFAMTTALNIVKNTPALKNELRLVVENVLPYGSPGIKSRGKKDLYSLEKIKPA